jgi:hypothetical protein
VHGYVSAPKYSAELAAGAAPGSSLSPTPNASPNPNASVPLQ